MKVKSGMAKFLALSITTLALASLVWGQSADTPERLSARSKSTFQVVATPNPNPNNDDLAAVAASSASNIWAVGSAAIHFDGTAWTGFTTALVDGVNMSPLSGVAVLSPTNAWAVGTFDNNGMIIGVIEQWDGTKWNLVPGPFDPGSTELLFGMTAISAKDIWAVGGEIVGGTIQPMFIHFNGKVWKQVPGPMINTQGPTFMQSVAAVAANDVWAVGWSGFENDNSQTFVEHWDGHQWSVVASPSVGAGANQLNSVVAIAPNDIWAAGFSVAVAPPAEAPQQTLIEHWDGSTWSVVSSPNTGHGQFQSNRLFGVTAVSANDVWAFGSAFNKDGSGQQKTLLLHWNGTQWSKAASPNPHPKTNPFLDDLLFGGVVTGPGEVWIVGSEDEAPSPFTGTLVLHTTGG